MMKEYRNVSIFNLQSSIFNVQWLLLGLMALVMSCQGNKGGEAAQQKDGLYGAEARERSMTAEEQAKVQKARVVRLYEIPAPLTDRPEQILHKKGFTISYNRQTKTPNWVAWHLTKSHTKGSNQRAYEQFAEDVSVSEPRATDNDYYNSRYDRGHMCPAGDNKWDKQAMEQSFLFTNICPQNHGLNKYEWNDVEILCREWAYQYGAVDIVCGPIYSTSGVQKIIGKNKVWVPDAFFKVVLCRQGKAKAIGFVYRNEGKKQPMADAVRSVDEIERLTGMDFFPELDDETEDKIEKNSRLSDW